jgi:proline racemase
VSGYPEPEGRTQLEKRRFAREHLDSLRRLLIHEPRGHADMYGCVITEPTSADGHFGVLFLHNEGYSTMCGHGIIAVTKIALERGLITAPRAADGTIRITLDAPAGPIEATAIVAQGFSPADLTVTSVRFRNVPSFVLHPGVIVRVGNRDVRADVAFGGAFYAIVDSEAVGIPVVPQRLADLRRVGMEIKHAVEQAVKVEHPLEPQLQGIYGTIFTGPPSDERADLRNVTIFADAEVDRSPCGTGTAAVMAVLSEMGVLTDEAPFVHESIVGTTFTGRIVSRQRVGERQAIVPSIEGSAWITGEPAVHIDGDDPLKAGFRL